MTMTITLQPNMDEILISIKMQQQMTKLATTSRERQDFPNSVVLIFFVLVITLIIRFKWQRYTARKEKTEQLLNSLSEESRRLEQEFYGRASPLVYSCSSDSAFCYSPSKYRCAQCKAAKYCSVKCQIIHWRQGHNHECHPRCDSSHINDDDGQEFGEVLKDSNHINDADRTNDNDQVFESRKKKKKKKKKKNAVQNDQHNLVNDGFKIDDVVEKKFEGSNNINNDGQKNGDDQVFEPKKKNASVDDHHNLVDDGFKCDDVVEKKLEGSNNINNSGQENDNDQVFEQRKKKSATENDHRNLINDGFKSDDVVEDKLEDANNINDDGRKNDDGQVFEEKKRKNVTENNHHDLINDGVNGNDIVEEMLEDSNNINDDVRLNDHGQEFEEKNEPESDDHDAVVGFGEASTETHSISRTSGNNVAYERYKAKELFSFDSFVKLYTSKEWAMKPCGLKNCGNSCFANSVFQCLAFTPPLTAYFAKGLHSTKCKNKEWCFLCEFEKLIMKVKKGKTPISPQRIISHLKQIGSPFGRGTEEDAHEFLRYAIDDMMEPVCLKEAGISSPRPIEEKTTLIGLTFRGSLHTEIKCTKCQNKSEREETMKDLVLGTDKNVKTLEQALRRFSATEILDGAHKYSCGRCESYEKAEKKLTISETPNILTIVLNRAQEYLNKSIQFPEILDLTPYINGTCNDSPVYMLYGVIVYKSRRNSISSGHYVSYIKNSQDKWFKANDTRVSSVELKSVLSQNAYILLYARSSPRALQRESRSRQINSTSIRPNSRPTVESSDLKFSRLQKMVKMTKKGISKVFHTRQN